MNGVLLDVFIIVLGVFVATQVTNWNAARLTYREQRAATARLVEDLRGEAWGCQTNPFE